MFRWMLRGFMWRGLARNAGFLRLFRFRSCAGETAALQGMVARADHATCVCIKGSNRTLLI
jgi:hypothetical protein